MYVCEVCQYVEFVHRRWDFVLTPSCGFTLIRCLGRTAVSMMRFVPVHIKDAEKLKCHSSKDDDVRRNSKRTIN